MLVILVLQVVGSLVKDRICTAQCQLVVYLLSFISRMFSLLLFVNSLFNLSYLFYLFQFYYYYYYSFYYYSFITYYLYYIYSCSRLIILLYKFFILLYFSCYIFILFCIIQFIYYHFILSSFLSSLSCYLCFTFILSCLIHQLLGLDLSHTVESRVVLLRVVDGLATV